MIRNHIFQGDAIASLAQLPDDSINCVVTSPPYWGLRDYGVGGQIGMEATPAEFVAALVRVFREVRRVLREDGVCWVNMGDSYATSGGNRKGNLDDMESAGIRLGGKRPNGFVDKNRLGMPHRLVFGLQDDGWIWRDEIIWHKPNPMPESVRDRTTKAHEYVFMLTKRERYWYDQQAIAENASYDGRKDLTQKGSQKYAEGTHMQNMNPNTFSTEESPRWRKNDMGVFVRNRRSVFSIPSEPTPFAHFATYPQALIEPFILAGCPARTCAVCGAPHVRETERVPMVIRHSERPEKMGEFGRTQSSGTMISPAQSRTIGFAPTCTCAAATIPGIVYDPFMGSGTTALVARRLGRDYLGSELNPEYHALAVSRLAKNDAVVKAEIKTGISQLALWG